ncbi:MAG: metallophosphoesterase [Litoreibacter sp.]|nr:metallophosphoesterase [Litoreibacter sp.]
MASTYDRNLSDPHRAGFFKGFADYWWGAYTRIKVTKRDVLTPKLAPGESLTIAIVSDIHADQRFMPLSRVAEVVEKTNALKPDLIYMGGDLRAQDNRWMTPEPLPELVDVLADLRAPFGVFATTGNHDWWDDPATQRRDSLEPECVPLLRAAGITVLRNEAVQLDHPSHIWVSGIDSQWAYEGKGRDHGSAHDLEAALSEVPFEAFGLLLAHEPDIFPKLPKRDLNGPIDLVLSGHTHGGQIKVFHTRPIIPSHYGRRYAYGHRIEDGRDLIVSAGLGCSLLPLRFGVMPEITLVTVRSG